MSLPQLPPVRGSGASMSSELTALERGNGDEDKQQQQESRAEQAGDDDSDGERRDRAVAELARTFSRASAATSQHEQQHRLRRVHSRADGGEDDIPTPVAGCNNPFLSDDPALDPSSPHFSAKSWAMTLLHAFSQDPDRYARHTVGVSFRDVGVHGFGGGGTDYQKDVLNVLWRAPLMVAEWLSKRRSKVQILRDFNGLVEPGEMLLVLGRPGSGVSTLLKTIAGQTHGLNLGEGSMFNYQGIPWDKMHTHFRGERIYQAETDVHFPMLTVGETLQFAAAARTPANRLPGVSRHAYATHLRDVVMAMFGISHTVNTRVGNDLVRGVSGGERKRVSIAEVTLNTSTVQCWDNSTRGLDSATALEFARVLRLSTELGGTAAVVAIYQASQAAYDTFDKVTLLYAGRQIFFGPIDAAKPYFVDMGYHCPDRQTTADFLTSLTNPAERVVRPGFENRVPRTPDEFAEAWKRSPQRDALLGQINSFNRHYPCNDATAQVQEKFYQVRKAQQAPLVRNKSPFTISVPMQIKLCIVRGWQRFRRDQLFFLVTVFGSLAVSLVLGSVYYDLPPTAESINTRCILVFVAVLFNALKSVLEIFSLYAQRPIVEKQARYALYHPFCEAIASAVCDLPTKILSTITFNVPLYFMAGLRQDSAGPFFIFMLFGFMCTMAMSMILRTIGQTSRTVHQALTPAAMFILLLVIYGGFILPVPQMQGWLRWINYLNPIAYGYEALLANELAGINFPCSTFVPMGPPYADAGPAERACAVAGAMPGEGFVSGDFLIGNAFGYYRSNLWRDFGILWAFTVFFFVVYVLAAEYIIVDPSKGEILIFRQGFGAAKKGLPGAAAAADEESGEKQPAATVGHGHDPAAAATEKRDLQQQSKAIFHWRDVCYNINIKGEDRRILDRVDGWVKPGTLTALMGATGAGKTTLLDVLANRVTMGVVTGDMLINGQARGRSFQRKTGYVQQQDLHLETSTVREALRFSAVLRQPAAVPLAEKHAYVEHVIGLLEMAEYADAVIGVPGEGLNVEQRKRLTIGVELVAKPDLLLFLDEPTSGLDSQTAWSVATLIRRLSDNGQAILCTIHQPSALLFQQFDRLLLLAKGGRTVYFGDIGRNAEKLTSYFEHGGAAPCGADENPAEWMLQVIGAAPGARASRDWAEAWRESPEAAAVRAELAALEALSSKSKTAAAEEEDAGGSLSYAAPTMTQYSMLLKRVFQQYWRTPSYIYAKLILCGGTSLLIGLSFYKIPLSQQGLQSQMFSIFMLLVIFAFLVYQTMPHFITQRDQYEARERASRTYSWPVFIASNLTAELPWNTLAAVLIFAPFYYLVGMHRNAQVFGAEAERGGLMFLMIWVFMMFESTYAQMVIAGIETAEVGATVALLLFFMTLVFCGVAAPPDALPRFWIFMYHISPFTYLMGSILSVGVGGVALRCTPLELLRFNPPTSPSANTTCGEYMAPFLSFGGGEVYNPDATAACEFCPLRSTDDFLRPVKVDYSERWRNFGLIWVYILFNVAAALFLYWLARVPKKGGGGGGGWRWQNLVARVRGRPGAKA